MLGELARFEQHRSRACGLRCGRAGFIHRGPPSVSAAALAAAGIGTVAPAALAAGGGRCETRVALPVAGGGCESGAALAASGGRCESRVAPAAGLAGGGLAVAGEPPEPGSARPSSGGVSTPASCSQQAARSEERRVGKECRSRWSRY